MSLILNGTDGLSDVDGTAATPAIRGTDANTGIFFPAADTIAFSEGGAEAMRIDSSGNVGIGSSSISNKLEVVQSASGDSSAAIRAGVSGYAASLKLIANDIGGSRFNTLNSFYGSTEQWSIRSGASDATMTFCTGSSATERMRITSDGVLALATTTTGGSTPGKQIIYYAQNLNWGIFLNETTGTSSGAYAIAFGSTGNLVGRIETTNSATSYVTSSDYRLKDNVAPMTGALAKVQQLKPCTYKWKIDGKSSQGFIAHELQAVIPEAVSGEKDAVDTYTDEDGNEQTRIKPQGIDTSFVVATLTAAIQELNAKVEAQAVRIAELEGAK